MKTLPLIVVAILVSAGYAAGQATAQVEPIRCWWQTSVGAITIGQTFTLTLTCAALDTEAVHVVPDESRLGVASVQLSPFEVLGGDHPPDSRTGSRRFFQYRYQLRVINPDVIGHDVNIQALTITYRVHSTMAGAATLEGRDLAYILPVIPLKVLSLVPDAAPDIRDGGDASLASVAALRFRSSVFRLAAATFAVLALVLGTLALVPRMWRERATGPTDAGRVPDRRVLQTLAEELADVQGAVARDAWGDPLVDRALRALRLVAAHAIGRAVSQRPLAGAGRAPEGRLAVQHGRVGVVRASVASSITADDVARAISDLPAEMSETRRQQLGALRSGLLTLTAAVYPEAPVRDPATLDDVVRHGLSMAQQLARSGGRWSRG